MELQASRPRRVLKHHDRLDFLADRLGNNHPPLKSTGLNADDWRLPSKALSDAAEGADENMFQAVVGHRTAEGVNEIMFRDEGLFDLRLVFCNVVYKKKTVC